MWPTQGPAASATLTTSRRRGTPLKLDVSGAAMPEITSWRRGWPPDQRAADHRSTMVRITRLAAVYREVALVVLFVGG